MLSKKIVIAAFAGTALLAASGAYARHDNHRWDGPRAGYGQRHQGHYYGHRHYRHAPRVYVRPAPAYYYDYAPPVYYAPRPVITYRQPGFSLFLGL